MTAPLHTVSYGGGVQSTALLALAAAGTIPHRVFLFANTGDDSEAPETLAYVREVAAPFAAANGLELHELDRVMRDGSIETVLSRIARTAKSEVIPVRSSAGGPPLSRSCTADFKRKVLGRWLKANGATAQSPAHVAVGISLDEIHRANRKAEPYERLSYPLVGIGEDDCCATTLKVRRNDCRRIILDAGLPVPPKSSCWFCPFHSLSAWQDQRRDTPETFAAACQLERDLTAKAGAPRYLTRYGAPLASVVPADADLLPLDWSDEEEFCTDGACAT